MAHVSGSDGYGFSTDPTTNTVSCAAGTGNNTMVFAFVAISVANLGSSWTATFNGNSMTNIGTYTPSGNAKLLIFAYPAGNNPGTANVVFSSNASTGSCTLIVSAFDGMEQSSYTDVSATATATDNAPNVDITPNVDNTVIVSMVQNFANEDPVIGDETEIRTEYTGVGWGTGASFYIQTTAALRNMNFSLTSGADVWYMLAVNVKEAGGSAQNITGAGAIASVEAFGTAVITTGAVTLSPSGITSAEAFGTSVVTVGAVTLSPSGIASAEAHGSPGVLESRSPNSDISVGNWGKEDWTVSNIYQSVDENDPSDTDYIKTHVVTGTPSVAELAIASVGDPTSSNYHILKYRYRKVEVTAKTVNLTVRLMQGAVEVASWVHSDIGTAWVDAYQTLSGAQADAITDYSNLRVKFEAIEV